MITFNTIYAYCRIIDLRYTKMIREVIRLTQGSPLHEAPQNLSLEASLPNYEAMGELVEGGGGLGDGSGGGVHGGGGRAVGRAGAGGGLGSAGSSGALSVDTTVGGATAVDVGATLGVGKSVDVGKSVGVGKSVDVGKSVSGGSSVGVEVFGAAAAELEECRTGVEYGSRDQGVAARERATWHGKPTFASTDKRLKTSSQNTDHEEKRAASVIVNELNLFARQGRGGQHDLNGYSSVKHCKLCEKRCTCLTKCSGPPPSLNSRVSRYIKISPPTSIPGLNETGVPSTTLTKIEKSLKSSASSGYHKLRDMFNYAGARNPTRDSLFLL